MTKHTLRDLMPVSRRTLLRTAAGGAILCATPVLGSAGDGSEPRKGVDVAGLQLGLTGPHIRAEANLKRIVRLIEEHAQFAGPADFIILPTVPMPAWAERTLAPSVLSAKATEYRTTIVLPLDGIRADAAVFTPGGDMSLADGKTPRIVTSACALAFSPGEVHLVDPVTGREACTVTVGPSRMRITATDCGVLSTASGAGQEIIRARVPMPIHRG